MRDRIINFFSRLLVVIVACITLVGFDSINAYATPTQYVDYTLGQEYSGTMGYKGGYCEKYFNVTLTGNSHFCARFEASSKINRMIIYDANGNVVSSESNTIGTNNDMKTNFVYTHSCNLNAGNYQVMIGKNNYNDNPVYFMATAEPIISLGSSTISDLSMPQWGTVKATLTGDNNALGYETHFSTTTDFSSPIVIDSISSVATASGFNAGLVYVRTRSYASYSDGVKVYSGWSMKKAIEIPELNATISDLSMPQWGTVKATLTGDNNALGYETHFSTTTDFSSPIVIDSISSVATASGFNAGLIYVRTRSYTSFSDGTKVYSGWSKIKALEIPKINNKLDVAARTANVKFNKLKKSKQVLAISKVINFKNKGQGTKTYIISSVKKGRKSFKGKITIAKTTGKVTLKKGLKKGVYKVKVKVKAAGNTNYKVATKTVTFKIKVK